MAVVLRRENGRLRRYAHLGTGNYHPRTARLYTDFGLLTADPKLCEDMDKVFAQLTGLGARCSLKSVDEVALHHARRHGGADPRRGPAAKGGRARIMAKMNSLLEEQIIEEPYKASQAGVKIDLIVRGVCALRAGVPGLSENIRVRSIVGRFLEHSRVFYFLRTAKKPSTCRRPTGWTATSSVAWKSPSPSTTRRLKKRVIDEAFTYALRDNQLAWQQQPDGDYARVKSRREPFNPHLYLMQKLGV